MKGRRVVFIVLITTIVCLILTWFWLQDVIVDFDLERAMANPIHALL